jgi:hypothetical protein
MLAGRRRASDLAFSVSVLSRFVQPVHATQCPSPCGLAQDLGQVIELPLSRSYVFAAAIRRELGTVSPFI